MRTVVEVTPISSLYVSIYSEMNYQFRSHSFFFLHFTVEGQGTSTRQGPNFGGDVERAEGHLIVLNAVSSKKFIFLIS